MPNGRLAIASLILGFILLLQVGGCKDSGSVGGGLSGPGSDIMVDTLRVTQVQTDTITAYSGALNFFSAGRFQDPVFGDVTTTGLIKPALASSNDNVSFGENARMQLKLTINKDGVYGDSLAGEQFNLVELSDIFRGKEFKLNNEVQTTGSTVGTFTVTDEDTVKVDLSDAWVQKYGEFHNSTDSMRTSKYRQQFAGLAIVPQNAAKIVAFEPGEIRFIATQLDVAADADSATSDSLLIPASDWAYRLARTNVQTSDPGSSKIFSTQEQVVRFDYDFSLENLGSRNISRVELLFYRDNLVLENSDPGGNVDRQVGGTVYLHVTDGDELPQALEANGRIASGTYDAEDGAYHIDLTQNILTRQLEDIDSDQSFYITLGANNGVIRSSILFNGDAARGNQPKIIVTSIKTENN